MVFQPITLYIKLEEYVHLVQHRTLHCQLIVKQVKVELASNGSSEEGDGEYYCIRLVLQFGGAKQVRKKKLAQQIGNTTIYNY